MMKKSNLFYALLGLLATSGFFVFKEFPNSAYSIMGMFLGVITFIVIVLIIYKYPNTKIIFSFLFVFLLMFFCFLLYKINYLKFDDDLHGYWIANTGAERIYLTIKNDSACLQMSGLEGKARYKTIIKEDSLFLIGNNNSLNWKIENITKEELRVSQKNEELIFKMSTENN